MASNYGLNFGFRRSDESVSTREGRYRTPVSGTLRLGTAVQIDSSDPDDPYRLKQCAGNAAALSGICGLLVQEEDHIYDQVFGATRHDSHDLGVAKPDTLSVIWAGVGTKVWFRNTPARQRAGRPDISAVTIVDVTGLGVGDQLGWDGSKWVKVTGGITEAWLNVTEVSGSGSSAYVEAVVLF